MSYREADDQGGIDKGLAAKLASVNVDVQARKAFRKWLDASKEWSNLCQAIEANGASLAARRKLEELERRLNSAADVFEQTQQQLSDSSPPVATEEATTLPGLVAATWRRFRTKSRHRTPNRR